MPPKLPERDSHWFWAALVVLLLVAVALALLITGVL
jgi:hypothetical protein